MSKQSETQKRKQFQHDIVTEALELSHKMIMAKKTNQAKPLGVKAEANYKMILAICRELVPASGPITCPEPSIIAHHAKAVQMQTPPSTRPLTAAQTVKNTYRDIVAIWRSAYDRILAASATNDWVEPTTRVDPKSATTVSREAIMENIIRKLKIQNDELRALLKNTVDPETDGQQEVSSPEDRTYRKALAEWIKSLNSLTSLARVSDIGLQLNRNARPDLMIMDLKALEALKFFATKR